MHRLPHEQHLFRYRLASALLLVKWLIIPGSLAFLGHAVIVGNRDRVHLALGLVALTLMVLVVQWFIATKCRCPLCLGTPLARKACVMHRNATRLFGSYRLRVAHSIIWKGYFRCPFCGETTLMEVRQRRRYRDHQ
jgi:hypothetical protein